MASSTSARQGLYGRSFQAMFNTYEHQADMEKMRLAAKRAVQIQARNKIKSVEQRPDLLRRSSKSQLRGGDVLRQDESEELFYYPLTVGFSEGASTSGDAGSKLVGGADDDLILPSRMVEDVPDYIEESPLFPSKMRATAQEYTPSITPFAEASAEYVDSLSDGQLKDFIETMPASKVKKNAQRFYSLRKKEPDAIDYVRALLKQAIESTR